MFRRGNLLDPQAHGGQFAPDNNSDPDVLYLYRWDQTTPKEDPNFYVQPGDTVAIFDTERPYPTGSYELAVVVNTEFADIPKNPGQCFPPNCGEMSCECASVLKATLDRDLMGSYQASPLDFASGRSAAVGVISGCDASTNQINGPGSCFYDADLRGVEVPFRDGYVEVLGRREGSGAVPYLPEAWFDWANADPGRLPMLHAFSNLWFANKQLGASPPDLVPKNYFHLVGASSSSSMYGGTFYPNDWSFLYQGKLEADFPDFGERTRAQQWVCAHELVHQFNVNPEDCRHHDTRLAWCESQDHCGAGGSVAVKCLMNVDPTDYETRIKAGVARLCKEDLLMGKEPLAGLILCNGVEEPWEKYDGSLRPDTEPQ